MFYDATDDLMSREDIMRIEARRLIPSEWQEIHSREEETRSPQIGDGKRFSRGNGGYGAQRPDGRKQSTGNGVIFQRGSKLTEPTRSNNNSGNKFTCRDRQGVDKTAKVIGASIYSSSRNMDIIEEFHFRRLLNTFPELSREYLVREAKRLSYTEVGVWDMDKIVANRITYPIKESV